MPTPAPTAAPTPAPTSPPGGGFTSVTLKPATSGSKVFAFGHGFKQGDVPSGSALTGLQLSVQSTWPDGSAKIGVVAGSATFSAGVPLAVSLVRGTGPTGSALTTADLKATGVTAAIGCGSFGTVSWATTDWDSPFKTFVSGPLMSSWIYRKQVGTDRHLVAWLEVRLFQGGAVEVLPWIENGFIRVTSPTTKSATYTFTLGGTQRFNAAVSLGPQQRTPLISGTLLSHWLGTDPGLTVRHNAPYMQATRLVPTYMANVPASATVVTSLPSSFVPLQVGNYTPNMGDPGYSVAIGLIAEWDVLYLVCSTSDAPWAGLQRNAYSAGRWKTHYRDENTNRPLRFSQYPNLSTNASSTSDYPADSGTGTRDGWDIAHQPSMGYMAYLVTGRWYFVEETQFGATANYLFQTDSVRQFSNGIVRAEASVNQMRGFAWYIRTLAQAVCATPDSDTTLKAELQACLDANIKSNHDKYVAQPNNPFGLVESYGNSHANEQPVAGQQADQFWMQDFATAAFGYTAALQVGSTASMRTKANEFFAWKALSAIGRLGGTGSTEWLYRDAVPYEAICGVVPAPVDFAGGTGPWPANWGVLYNATYAWKGNPGPRTTGDLRGGNFPGDTSYWGNLQPAISYAVDFGVPGAAEAYARMSGASNWSQMVNAFNINPVWSVRPMQ